MVDAWDSFWMKRNKPLSKKTKLVFYKNFAIIESIITSLFWKNRKDLSSLEIGCGRATISDLLAKRLGFETWTMDRIVRSENMHPFLYCDVLEEDWQIGREFDLIISYGLLEHFLWKDQRQIINNCVNYLAPGGVQIHYVVPQKMTNIFEDRIVYRDACNELKSLFNPLWVYPIIGGQWLTNKILAKGFFIYIGDSHENNCSSYRKISIH